jgi:hypothetical protein
MANVNAGIVCSLCMQLIDMNVHHITCSSYVDGLSDEWDHTIVYMNSSSHTGPKFETPIPTQDVQISIITERGKMKEERRLLWTGNQIKKGDYVGEYTGIVEDHGGSAYSVEVTRTNTRRTDINSTKAGNEM